MLRSRMTWKAVSLLMMVVAGCAKDRNDPMANPKYLGSQQLNTKDVPLADTPDILPQTYYAAGNLFASQGQISKAIEQYRKAIAVHHSFTAAYHRLGRALSVSGQHEEAAQALAQAVELKPGVALLRNDYGYELMYLARWDESEEQFRKAIEADSKLARAYINLGLVLSRTDRFEEALDAFRTVLPEADARYNLGLLYRGQKRYAEAVEEFRRVLEIDPQFPAARIQLDQLAVQLESSAMRQREALATTAPEPEPVKPNHHEEPQAHVEALTAAAPIEPTVAIDETRVSDSPFATAAAPKHGSIRLPASDLAESFATALEAEIKHLRNEAMPVEPVRSVQSATASAATPGWDSNWLRRELDEAYSDRVCEADRQSTLFPARLVRDEFVSESEPASLLETPSEPESVIEVVYRDDSGPERFEGSPSDWRREFRRLEMLTGIISNDITCWTGSHPAVEVVDRSEGHRATIAAETAGSAAFGSPVATDDR